MNANHKHVNTDNFWRWIWLQEFLPIFSYLVYNLSINNPETFTLYYPLFPSSQLRLLAFCTYESWTSLTIACTTLNMASWRTFTTSGYCL